MRGFQRGIWFLLVAILLACQPQTPPPPAPLPTWHAGLWWAYALHGPNFERFPLPGEGVTVAVRSVRRVVVRDVRAAGEPFYLVGEVYDAETGPSPVFLRLVHRRTFFEVHDPALLDGGMMTSVTWLAFPLVVGKRWETVPGEGEAYVESVETVRVPAGVFLAYRVRYEAPGVPGRTLWYAVDVQAPVRVRWENGSEWQLTDWGQADPAQALETVIAAAQQMARRYPHAALLAFDILERFHLAEGRRLYREAVGE